MQVNNYSSTTLNNINAHQKESTASIAKMATGKTEPLSDAALALIANAIGSDISGLTQGLANANDAVSMMQIADGVLSGLSQSADDLNVLAVKGNSAALNSDQKAMLHDQAAAITRSMQNSINNASFNGKSLFDKEMSFSLGNSSVSTNLPAIDLSSSDLKTQEGVAEFMKTLHAAQISVGATMSELESSTNSIFAQIESLSASKSQMSDIDMAKEVTNYKQEGIMLNASLMAQSHQNTISAERVSQLLG